MALYRITRFAGIDHPEKVVIDHLDEGHTLHITVKNAEAENPEDTGKSTLTLIQVIRTRSSAARVVQAVSTPPQPPTQPPPISSSSTSVTPSGSSTPNVEQIAQHYQKQFQQHQQHAQQQAQLQMQSIHHLVTEKEQLLQKIGQLETHIQIVLAFLSACSHDCDRFSYVFLRAK